METRLIPAVLVLLIFACCINIPICNKPYIPVGQECCLDTNDNNICDTDETTTTTTASTTTTTLKPSTTTTKASTTTSSTTSTTTTTSSTSTSTSTTTTTQKKLPVSEVDYMAHISGSEEYQELQKVYDEDELRMGVGSRTYEFVKRQLEYVEKEYNMTKSCLGCFDFSRSMLWVAEFGSEDVAYMNALDRETGTGATYRYARKANKYTCWCDSI